MIRYIDLYCVYINILQSFTKAGTHDAKKPRADAHTSAA